MLSRLPSLPVIPVVLLFGVASGVVADDTTLPEVARFEEALAVFNERLDDFRKAVADDLQTEIAKARNASDVAAVQGLEGEKEQFETHGYLPTILSRPMQRQLALFVKPFERTSELTVRSLTRGGHDAEADRVREAAKQALGPIEASRVRSQLIGRWAMKGPVNAVFVFRPDGTVYNENSKQSLPYEIDIDLGTITVQGPGWRDRMLLPLNPGLTKGKNAGGRDLQYRKVR